MRVAKYIIFLICLYALPSAFCAERAVVLGLDEAIAIALRDNREILLDQEELAKAGHKIQEAKSAYLPEVKITSGNTYTRGLYRKDINSYSFQAGLKQYLYQGGKAANTLKQAEYEQQAQEAALEKSLAAVIKDVKKSFYAFLIAREFAGLNQRVLENQFAHLEAIKEKQAKGEASESEMLKALHGLSDARYLQEASLNQLENAKTLFKDILALENKTEVELSGDFEYSPKEIAVDSAILKALEARPEIREYAALEKADASAVEIARSGGRPSIYGTFDYYSRSTTSLSFSPGKGWQDYNTVGFTFSWPVFDGWLTKAKVEQALSDLKQDRIMRDKLQADIASQVKNAYLSLKTALAGLEPKKREIELYQDYLKTAEDKYKEGILSALGLDDVRLALEVSDFNRRQGLYDCLTARAELDLAMGVK